jgi:hypothetical protein
MRYPGTFLNGKSLSMMVPLSVTHLHDSHSDTTELRESTRYRQSSLFYQHHPQLGDKTGAI